MIPWKILDECPAKNHNTVHSSRGYRGHPKCICPRALVLRGIELDRARLLGVQRRNSKLEAGREKAAPQWLRAGPWRISPLCIARGHNTLMWARGGRTCSEAKCTCPHALYVLAEFKASRRGQNKHVAVEQVVTSSPSAPRAPEPDWTQAVCRRYPKTADGGFDERMNFKGQEKREAAKKLCKQCPLLAGCAAWIVRKEGEERGSWGGVYAGMDQWNRQGYRMHIGYRGRAEKVKL